MNFYKLSHPSSFAVEATYARIPMSGVSEIECESGFEFESCTHSCGHTILVRRTNLIKGRVVGKLRDQPIIWTRNGGFDIVVSRRFQDQCSIENIQGIDFGEVEIQTEAHTTLSQAGYKVLTTNAMAYADLKASGYQGQGEQCPICGYQELRRLTPTGLVLSHVPSDVDVFFVKQFPLWTIVSERMVEVIVQNKVWPCVIWRIDEIPFICI